jgi:hypothetical protein
MLLQELFRNLNLAEARRNPGQNEKLSGHPAAIKFLKGKDLRNYGVSMTSIPKLGINPGSNYNTPVGIYFYPAEFYMQMKEDDASKKLPFVDDAPYIQIFELAGNVEDIDKMDVTKYNSYISKLYANINKVSQLLNISENYAHKEIADALMSAGSQAKDSSYGGRLWYVLYTLSRAEGAQKRSSAAPRSSVIWNSLLRIIGMDGVIDNGAGIIHKNEPFQGVILDPRSLRHVETIENKSANKIDTMSNEFTNLANMKVDDYYVNNVVQYVRELNLKYNPAVRKYCDKIINNVVTHLQKWPGIYKRLDISDINYILQLTKNAEVVKELTVGYYAAKFPKVKQELDDIVAELQEYINDPAEKWEAKTDVRKKRAYEIIVPQYRRDAAQTMIASLKKFKNDPRASQMTEELSAILSKLEQYKPV